MMASISEKRTLARLFRETIVNLCHSKSMSGGPVEVDGIICISGQKEGDEVVVKVHERIRQDHSVVKALLFPDNEPGEDTGVYQHHNGDDGGQSDDGGSTAGAPCKRFKEEEPSVASPASDMEDQGGDLSSNYDDASSEHNGTQYLGKSAYLSSPYHLQKKTQIRSERWTPTMPIPTTPECKACGFTFENFDVLSEHNEAVHSVFTCNSCHKTFTSRSNLERHSRLHTGFKPYVCAICQKAFSRKDHLSNHAAKHAFKCATCNKRFADKKSLASHFSYEHDAPLSHVCDFCNKGFSNHELYEEHVKTHPQYHVVMQRFHSSTPSPRRLSCPQCQFTTYDRIQLLKHSLQHNDNHRCYTCLSCAKSFSDPLKYDDHLMLHKTEQNIFECCLCRQIFPSFDVLKRHEQAHLTECEGGDLLPCSHCDKLFRDGGELHEHLLMHRTLIHRCTFCQQAFSSYAELNQHMHELRHYPQHPTDLSMHPHQTPAATQDEEEQNPADKLDDLGSDIEVVEPQAPEEDIEQDDAEQKPEQEIKTEPAMRSLLASSKLNQERARKRKAPSPEKFVPAPPPYVEPAMGGYYRPAEPYEIAPQDLSMKTVNNHMSAMAARAAAAFAEEHLRAAHERYRLDLERLERERQERDRYEKMQRERECQRTPQPAKPGIDIPPGPQTCSVCNTTYATFHEMETHCFVEHNRSPCMFCSKTFAQKANRDRHVCLHTGDKPYSCPDCDEKFSRGDKLKLHRVRAHNLQVSTPLLSKKEGSEWSSPSTNHSEDSGWQQVTPYKKEQHCDVVHAGGEWSMVAPHKKEQHCDVVHAGGEWSMVNEENGHITSAT